MSPRPAVPKGARTAVRSKVPVTAVVALDTRGWRGGWMQGLSYGAMGLPLAFVALPLYVVLPNHYASEFGIPLATLGGLLLGARLLDALADPWIGRLADGWFSHSAARVLAVAALAAIVLACGFRGLGGCPRRFVHAGDEGGSAGRQAISGRKQRALTAQGTLGSKEALALG